MITAFATALLLAGPEPAVSQAAAVDALRLRLLSGDARCIVKIDGLRATSDVLGRPSEMHVRDAVVSRGSSRWLHVRRDVVIPPGANVLVQNVQATGDANADYLRVNLVAAGAVVPVVFDLPKGALAGMSGPQLEAVVRTALQPAGATPPRDRVAPTTVSAAATAETATPAPAARPLDVAAVQTLRAHIVNDRLTFLKVGGLRGSGPTPDHVRDNLVVDGVVDRTTPTTTYRGSRSAPFPPYQLVQVLDAVAYADDEHEYLRIITRAPIGMFIPIKFVVPSGALEKMTVRGMERLIAPVIGLPGERNPHPPDYDDRL